MSYRIWWLIAFCTLGIGLAMEAEQPADPAAQAQSEPGAASLAAGAAKLRRG